VPQPFKLTCTSIEQPGTPVKQQSGVEMVLVGPQLIIFSDLDGTLLDHHTYSFAAAGDALDLVMRERIPLVFCSSKTRPEIEYWRKRMGNVHPFVSENGGGIFIPSSYFSPEDLGLAWPEMEERDEYHVLPLGKPYHLLREALTTLRKEGFHVQGFGDMAATEIAQITGLNLEQATWAKQREFDETFVFNGDQKEFNRLLASIRRKGLRYTQGKFHHLMGGSDKGRAVNLLSGLFQKKFNSIVTVAVGDSPNDLPMLENVDHPMLVQNYRGEHDQRINLPNLRRVEGIGPEGWSRAILRLLSDRSSGASPPRKS